MPPTETLRDQYVAARDAAKQIIDTAEREKREPTPVEQTRLTALVSQAKAHAAELKRGTEATRLVEQAVAAEIGQGTQAAPRGLHPWTKAITGQGAADGGVKAMEAFGMKSITGGGQGTVQVGSLGDPSARLGAPGGELIALVTVEQWGGARGDGHVVSFLRQATRSLHAAVVAEAAAKPESSIGLDMLTANIWTFAHVLSGVPLQWFTDTQNLDLLIREELAFGVTLAVEDAMVNGAGPLPATPLGWLHDAAIPNIPAGVDAPTSILAGLTAVSAAGYANAAVALNPATWESILSMKDLQERPIYGGSPFSGPARTLWSTPVALSNAIPVGSSVVGDFGLAVRMVEREQVQVIVGTQNDDLTKNLRTVVGEARETFATVRPQALCVVALPAAGTMEARSSKSK